MANARTGNVWRIDTSGAITDKNIHSIKFVGTTGSSASIQGGGVSSGTTVWEQTSTATVYDSDINIRDNDGFYVTINSGAIVYIYTLDR